MDEPEKLADTIEFNMQLGFFYSAWAVTDATLDFALGKFLRLTHEETHLLTAGMEFGRKATLLRNLLRHQKDSPQKSELLRTVKIIQNDSLRNVFAHSYLASDEDSVSFISRSRGGDYSATEYEFTKDEFREHVHKFIDASHDFYNALEVDDHEFFAFQYAALNVNSKS